MKSSSPLRAGSDKSNRNSPFSASSQNARLIQSTDTLPKNLPPDMDDNKLARQKRRRTSPEDQAILEIAYRENPKPERSARLQLVNRIALGEKEVQIWFQNRRQSSRRKSRPLLPHEIAQYSTFTTPFSSSTGSTDLDERQVPREVASVRQGGWSTSEGTQATEGMQPHVAQSAAPAVSESIVRLPSDCEAPGLPYTQLPLSSQDAGSRLGYLANRRSAPSLRPSQEDTVATTAAAVSYVEDKPRKDRRLKKSSSSVWLSMTSDGNARVVTSSSSPVPSPPRSHLASQPSFSSLDELANSRSQSSFRVSTQHNVDAAGSQSLRRSFSGRSRDSRAWEFWCDKDARNELEEKAKQETSGSASNAIGLLRSNSGRSILGAMPSKRNSLLSGQTAAKRFKSDPSNNSALQGSQCSLSRLQGKPHISEKSAKNVSPRLDFSGSAVEVYIPGNDSDKENWTPEENLHKGADQHSDTAAQMPSYGSPALGKRQQSSGLISTTSCSTRQRKSARMDTKNIHLEVNEEIAAFMEKSQKSTNVPEEDDFDCVQGLLSLSQGDWR